MLTVPDMERYAKTLGGKTVILFEPKISLFTEQFCSDSKSFFCSEENLFPDKSSTST